MKYIYRSIKLSTDIKDQVISISTILHIYPTIRTQQTKSQYFTSSYNCNIQVSSNIRTVINFGQNYVIVVISTPFPPVLLALYMYKIMSCISLDIDRQHVVLKFEPYNATSSDSEIKIIFLIGIVSISKNYAFEIMFNIYHYQTRGLRI